MIGGWTVRFSLLCKNGPVRLSGTDRSLRFRPGRRDPMPVHQLIASFGEFIPFIKTKLDVVLYNAFPFNLLKGLVITAFTMLVYKRIRPLLKGKD